MIVLHPRNTLKQHRLVDSNTWWRNKQRRRRHNYTQAHIPAHFPRLPAFGWDCGCGHWNTSLSHCPHCGAQPPWGCDCLQCRDDEEDPDQWWEHEWIEETV